MNGPVPATITPDDLVNEPMLAFFQHGHLPSFLQLESQPFATVALDVVRRQRRTPERTVCLRKLLEAKDCAVRNVLPPIPVMPIELPIA